MIRDGLAAACLAGLLVAGCASRPGEAVRPAGMAPREAIFAAADAAPRGVPGLFALLVQATGREGERVYLNSELDYRDQRNVTVNIAPAAALALTARHGAPPDIYFRGQAIQVAGSARRMRVDFTRDGRPTGKYYYQTHVAVTDPDQIRLAASLR